MTKTFDSPSSRREEVTYSTCTYGLLHQIVDLGEVADDENIRLAYKSEGTGDLRVRTV